MANKKRDKYSPERSRVWKENHNNIFNEHWRLYEETGKLPTQLQIAKNLGLAPKTVNSHMQDIDLHDGLDNHKKFRDEVINKLRKNSDAASLKLWLQVVFGFSEKKTVENIVKEDEIVKIEYVDKPTETIITDIKEAKG